MDADLGSLIHQKLDAIKRTEDAAMIGSPAQVWKAVGPAPQCPWVGELMRTIQRQCHESVVTRGVRMAQSLQETLKAVKPPYEQNLAAELKAIVDPFFPSDLCLAPALSTRGVYERHNRHKFDERAYELELTLVRVAVANASRDAKLKAHLVIDEYVLSVKPPHQEPQGFWARLWDAIELKLGWGASHINLKKLLSRRKQKQAAKG